MRAALRQSSREQLSAAASMRRESDQLDLLEDEKIQSSDLGRWRLDTWTARIRAALVSEHAQIALSSVGVLLAQLAGDYLRRVLVTEAKYGPSRDSFPQFTDFLGTLNAAAAAATAALTFLILNRPFSPSAPLVSYAGIGSGVVLAAVSDRQLVLNLGAALSALWKCPTIFVVMAWLALLNLNRFGWTEWLAAFVFVVGCGIGALVLPESFSSAAPGGLSIWGLASAALFVLFYLVGDGLSLSYQDKLFRDFSMPVVDQVLFVQLSVAGINVIGFLLGTHVGRVVGFLIDHPSVILNLLASTIPHVVMVFLMAFMLRLCGAVVCAMVSRIVALLHILLLASSPTSAFSVPCIVSMLLMTASLIFTMLRMSQTEVPPPPRRFFESIFSHNELEADEEVSIQMVEGGQSK